MLSRWWDFDETLAQAGGPAASPARAVAHPKTRWAAAVLGGIALGAALGWSLGRERNAVVVPAAASAPAPVAAPSTVPVATAARTSAAGPRRVTYRVQRGDSLWRIAAALTGEGHRWRELWPERKHGRLAHNEVLLIPAE